jgi:hypothetical protein
MARKKKIIKPIIDKHLTNDNYYRDYMYVTSSTLKLFTDNCEKKFDYLTNNPPKASSAMRFGTAFHMLCLEGVDEFNKHYAVEPDGIDKRTTLGKTTWLQFVESSQGKEHVSFKDWQTMTAMNIALREHLNSIMLFGCDEFEKIVAWENLEHKMLCKGKPDAISYKQKYIVDLKTTRNANPESFKETIIEQRYHMQAAYYCDALGFKDYYIYAIEKTKPHCVCLYKLSSETLEKGRILYNDAMSKFKMFLSHPTPTDYNNSSIYEI